MLGAWKSTGMYSMVWKLKKYVKKLRIFHLRIDIVCAVVLTAIFGVIYGFIMATDCKDLKESLNELKVDDCNGFKVGNDEKKK